MSTHYTLEPHPTAKVLLNTTGGDILLELFAKQTPLASRNFLQHCLDGYYDGTLFHRLVPGFVLQGGDPTGTGSGGESIYADEAGEVVAEPGRGGIFRDEFHSRLRFGRRGLLGMAGEGKDGNASQFFLTLGPTPELQGKNTLFGRVVGETVFNLVRMGEAEVVEGGERPLYPEKIVSAEVLVNPFEDMVRREIRAKRVIVEQKKEVKGKRKVGKAMLSFAGEDEEEGDVVPVVKRARLNPKFIGPGGEESDKVVNMATPKEKKTKAGVNARREASPKEQSRPKAASAVKAAARDTSRSPSTSVSPEPEEIPHTTKLSDTNRQIAELKASMRRKGPSVDAPEEKKKSILQAMIPVTATRGRKRGTVDASEQARSLATFNAFKKKLEAAPPEDERKNGMVDALNILDAHFLITIIDFDVQHETRTANDKAGKDAGVGTSRTNTSMDDEEANVCALHFIPNCQSCSKWDEEEANEEDDLGDGWMGHKLTFAKDRLGKDLEWKKKNEELNVYDPKEREIELGIKPKGDGGGKREWDRRTAGVSRNVWEMKTRNR
jgi:peptidyl-prolyl cis-trans isomerase SDCCAG10